MAKSVSKSSFYPPQRVLMGPGPSEVSPRVLAAMNRPTIGHLDPLFVTMMEEIKGLLRTVMRTENALTIPISGPGSAAMECCFANLLSAGDQVIVCQNGVFGGRMRENIERLGGHPIVLDTPWGRAVEPQRLEDALRHNPQANMVAFVHAETSTGVLSDAQELCAVAHRYDCLSVVDAVTSLAGVALEMDAWGIDVLYSGTQKCLSCPPGLAPLSMSESALERIKARQCSPYSWFLDLSLLMGYWQGDAGRSYHHTAPINALYGLHEGLLMVLEEGLEAAWLRHRQIQGALIAGLQAMGLELPVPEQERLPSLSLLNIPPGIEDLPFRHYLLLHFDLEIGAGLGPFAGRCWRIGTMGQSCRAPRLFYTLMAMEQGLQHFGFSLAKGEAVSAARAFLKNNAV